MTTDQTPHDDQRGLLIEAELTVDLPNAVIRLHTEGETLYVEARSFAALAELRTGIQSDAVDVFRHLGISSSLTVETPVLVRVGGVPVARYEPSTSPGRLASALGVAPFRPTVGGIMQAVWRQLRG